MAKTKPRPPLVVIFGDELFQKGAALQRTLDALLPPEVDRGLALADYDGTRGEDQGGPALAAVFDDLSTLPFLADRRVVLIRDADRFITTHREKLERYAAASSPTGTLVLDCRSFPKTTRLYKAVAAAGGEVIECRRLKGRELLDFVQAQARALNKRLDPAAAAKLIDQVGPEQGILAGELEKLALYALDRPGITEQDVAELVGQSREEKVFAAVDAAAFGRLPEALELWQQVLATDPSAIYKSLGGIAFKLRQWLTAHALCADGANVHSVAPRVMMYGRADELGALLRRLSARRLTRMLAFVADLDWQVKVGARSIEAGVESLLVQLAAA